MILRETLIIAVLANELTEEELNELWGILEKEEV